MSRRDAEARVEEERRRILEGIRRVNEEKYEEKVRKYEKEQNRIDTQREIDWYWERALKGENGDIFRKLDRRKEIEEKRLLEVEKEKEREEARVKVLEEKERG